jgi:hypothetical protein
LYPGGNGNQTFSEKEDLIRFIESVGGAVTGRTIILNAVDTIAVARRTKRLFQEEAVSSERHSPVLD